MTCFLLWNVSSRCSSNSEASASELLENLGRNVFFGTTQKQWCYQTHWCITSRADSIHFIILIKYPRSTTMQFVQIIINIYIALFFEITQNIDLAYLTFTYASTRSKLYSFILPSTFQQRSYTNRNTGWTLDYLSTYRFSVKQLYNSSHFCIVIDIL